MKLKLLFLGMLGAALLVGCNNDVIDPNGGPDDPNNPNFKGKSTYASFSLNLPGNAATYAGEDEVAAVSEEKAISDAVMFIYDWDGANMTAEAMAFVNTTADLTNGLATPHVTMFVNSGDKKIFLAVNSGGATPIVENNGNISTFIAKPDSGIPYSTQFTAMNKILESTASGFNAVSTLATTPVGTEGGSAGLIRTLAGGAGNATNGVLYSTTAYTTNTRFFMSNWDGPEDRIVGGLHNYTSDCLFTLLPNITAAQSKAAAVGSLNHIAIGVQRAIAKISLRITANGATSSSTAAAPYESSEGDGSKGRFTPWTVGGNSVWGLGGIVKRSTPFQMYTSTGAVSAPNYDRSWGDSVHFDAIKSLAADNLSLKWYDSYDNTRIYGTGKIYGTTSNTVSIIKSTMQTAANSLQLSNPDGVYGPTMRFAFAPENATEYPQMEDRGTYAIVGGEYRAQNWIGSITQAPVTSNPPYKGWNGSSYDVTFTNTNVYGTQYNAPTWVAGDNDTLYYISTDKVFIHGLVNLLAYYAWEKKQDANLGSALPQPVTAASAATLLKASVPAIDAVNDARAKNALFAYYQGQCFYRVWVRDYQYAQTSGYADEVLVRRNHIYDINISKIKGPGIADPNKIINPGPIPVLQTFVTADIKILDWHKVIQEEEGSFK